MCKGLSNKSKQGGEQMDTKRSSDKEEKSKDSRDGRETSRPITNIKEDNVEKKADSVPANGNAPSGGTPSQKTPTAKPPPKSSPLVQKWVQRALDLGVQQLREEYRALSKWNPESLTYEAFKQNQPLNRNRYQDVPCGDARRVTLKHPCAASDYIHANFVKTPHAENRFICTQGPLEGTVIDFWCMVIQEEVETIVMLCNLVEQGKIKCHKYFPMEKGETMVITPEISVTNTELRPMCPEEQSVKLSVLSLKYKKDDKEETREVRHYHWQDWPDRGVPPCRLTSMELLSRVRGSTKPIVVHCSAGIGRTGTIVAIEHVLECLQYGKEVVDMDKLLKELREQRAWSIQNDLQYLYIHRILLYYFLDKYKAQNQTLLTPENQEKYKKFIEDYEKATT